MDKWEYKIIDLKPAIGIEAQTTVLNTCGNEGWELVSVIETWVDSPVYKAYFKRKK
jgi:hypothetical protein